jgi:23S rRNA (cytidine1920-2'-O)/16S rRNA (cytidine1409-2'-O)-methyltransferase
MAAHAKSRIDLLLVERGLVPDRERALALILAGRVLVSEQKVEKAGAPVPVEAPIRLLGEEHPYVSRGGLKLAEALAHWSINVQGRACLDVGASTGGFTDCLLQHGAAQVAAVDTGFGQIAMKLRNDSRVHLVERTNARLLAPGSLAVQVVQRPDPDSPSCQGTTSEATEKGIGRGKKCQGTTSVVPQKQKNEEGALAPAETRPLTLLVMDVSFISATQLLGPVFAAAPTLAEAVILVKPQFEVDRGQVGKGGIVRDPEAHQAAIDKVAYCVQSLAWQVVETIPSPITGMEGNHEFLLYARRPESLQPVVKVGV